MKTLFFLIVVLFSCSLSAQDIQIIDTTANTVISTKGLRVRAQPNAHAEILGSLIFGEEVQITSTKSFRKDTFERHTFFYFEEQNEAKTYERFVMGNWVQINYENAIGYVFDAYLYWKPISDFKLPKTNINKDWWILFAGTDCFANFSYYPDVYYHGVYMTSNRTYELRPIEVNFFSRKYFNSPIGDIPSTNTTTNDNKNLLFVIGSRYPITHGPTTGKYSHYHSKDFNFPIYKNNQNERVSLDDNYLRLDSIEYRNHCCTYQVVIEKEGKSQKLGGVNHYPFQVPKGILWRGDLDRDGKDDYIIKYGDKSNSDVLYLSSEAEDGEIIKAVAVRGGGYCC